MKETREIMGMPVTIEILDSNNQELLENIFDYFMYVDEKFSTYKPDSEISQINRGELHESRYSDDMKRVFSLAEQTKKDTGGFFDIRKPDGKIDPSGIVKGWAINEAAKILRRNESSNFFIDAGGDIQVNRPSSVQDSWKIGIQNPFNNQEIVKVLNLRNEGLATSGTYNKGRHIYNPKNLNDQLDEVVSLSVVGPDIYEADRFATAAFAMGKEGINFIEKTLGLEGYQIDKNGTATFTTGFDKYLR